MKRTSIATLALLLVASSAAWANSYTIVDLGSSRTPTQINRHGNITGNDDSSQAFVYLGGRWHKLGCAHVASAQALNSRADVVGAGDSLPMLWPRRGECTFLPLPPAGASGVALGVATDGTVVGDYSTTGSRLRRCFIHPPAGISEDLGFIDGGQYCDVKGLNDDGQVVGQAATSVAGDNRAFLWQGGLFRNLGVLPGGLASGAMAINGKGHVVGFVNMPDATFRAFFWTPGGMRDLSDPAYANNYPMSINNRGAIVGQAWNRNNGVAVRFEAGRAIPLASEVVEPGNWRLFYANGVDDHGDIVGLGRRGQGKYHAFMLVPQAASAAAR